MSVPKPTLASAGVSAAATPVAVPASLPSPPTPLVLLHGWGLSPAVWDALRDELRAGTHPTTPVLTPALPGHAGAAPTATATLDAWADALAAQIPHAATVVGWSLGGMLALAFAARHPTRVARLVLLASTARFVALEAGAGAVPMSATDPDGAHHWPGLAAATVDTFRTGFATDPTATLKRFIALQSLGERERKRVQACLAHYLADPAVLPTATLAGLAQGLDILARSDLRAMLAQIPQPCLILHGEHDALMPLAAAHALAAQLANAQLHVLPDCGHALPLSQTARCARLIEAFRA